MTGMFFVGIVEGIVRIAGLSESQRAQRDTEGRGECCIPLCSANFPVCVHGCTNWKVCATFAWYLHKLESLCYKSGRHIRGAMNCATTNEDVLFFGDDGVRGVLQGCVVDAVVVCTDVCFVTADR